MHMHVHPAPEAAHMTMLGEQTIKLTSLRPPRITAQPHTRLIHVAPPKVSFSCSLIGKVKHNLFQL